MFGEVFHGWPRQNSPAWSLAWRLGSMRICLLKIGQRSPRHPHDRPNLLQTASSLAGFGEEIVTISMAIVGQRHHQLLGSAPDQLQ
jgi:hypothetical protein